MSSESIASLQVELFVWYLFYLIKTHNFAVLCIIETISYLIYASTLRYEGDERSFTMFL